MSCAAIQDIAQSIWKDLGEPTDISVAYIQSKLSSSTYLGKLNTLTGNCYALVNGNIVPPLGDEEAGIYASMYLADFYARKLAQLANGSIGPVLSLSEGDSRIVFVSVVDQMRLYRDMLKQLTDALDKQISIYRTDAMGPKGISFYNVSLGDGWEDGYGNGDF